MSCSRHKFRPLRIVEPAYFAGQAPAKVALLAGAVLLVTRRVKSAKVYREIDWPLLLMFAGLFIVVAGFEKAVVTPEVISAVGNCHVDQLPVLSLITAGLSNLVSNVPAVLVLKKRSWRACPTHSALG